jgi:hypothetical protein
VNAQELVDEFHREHLRKPWRWLDLTNGIRPLMVVLLCKLSYGSSPSTNGVNTGFYHLRRQVRSRWILPVHRIRHETTHRSLIGCGTY